MVYSMYRDSGVVQQGSWPELGDALQNLASLLEERGVVLLRKELYRNPIPY